MSSRVLRKLQGDKDKELIDEISDTETDVPVTGGARRKQLNLNRYDLLNLQSHSESEVKEDDNETEAPKSCEDHEAVKRKRKKKKRKAGKQNYPQRSSEDNADTNGLDEVERSVREVNRLLGESYTPNVASHVNVKGDKKAHRSFKSILSVQHKHLNPNNELKRIFGSKIIQAEHKKKNRGRGHVKSTWMANCKENWPQVGKSGLSMNLLETKLGIQYFAYEHSQTYRQTQNKFFEAVESLNPDNIVAIINEHPYHVDALLQLSDLCKLSEDLAMAAELVERALYYLECAFHPLFNVAMGNCRLDYRRQENRALYITAFKHLIFIGGRACWRTALEFCKLILSMDPDGDPLAVVLAIDFYALRAREYAWLKEFAVEWETGKNLSQLPNFAFSTAVAHFYMSSGDTQHSDDLLQHALMMFPTVLRPLLEKCSVQIDNRVGNHVYFSEEQKLRAREYAWLKEFAVEWETGKNLSQLPNFAFSTAVAHFYMSSGDTQHSDDLLQHALMMFPTVLRPLLEKCSVQIDNRVGNHVYFSEEQKQSPALAVLVQLYVNRSYHIWKDSDLLPWLEKNVHEVLDRVDRKDSIVKDYENKRNLRYQGPVPTNITRHVILSDIKGVTATPEMSTGAIMTFDPLPPKDSINIYVRPKRLNLTGSSSSSPLALFFRSILPNFNPNALPNLAEAGLDDGAMDAAAAALPDLAGNANDGGELHRSVASLVGAMRHLLNNIRPEVLNDADIDENDESDDDDLT